VITVPGVPVGGGYRVMPRSRAVLKLLDALAVGRARMSVEVSDKTTLLAAGEWARARGVGTVLFSHERLDRWIAARVPRLWKRGSAVLAPAVQCLRQLQFTHTADARAADGEVVQPRAQRLRQQRSEPPPPAILCGIADSDPDRVAEDRDSLDRTSHPRHFYQHGCTIRDECAQPVCNQ
jgi:hypothetical protein